MYCTKCGSVLDDSANCPKCGQITSQTEQVQPQPQQPVYNVPNRLEYFSPGLLLLFHYLTFGLFTMIWLGLMHDKMPFVRHDDPSAGKAIGFMFIPFFNLYWLFFNYIRLEVRVNEQLYWAKNPNYLSHGLTLSMCILMLIPYVNFIAFLVLMPIYAYEVQSKANWLVYARAGNQPVQPVQPIQQ